MTNVEKLIAKLDETGFRIGGITPGPHGTPETVAGEILKSIEEIENGNYEFIDITDEEI